VKKRQHRQIIAGKKGGNHGETNRESTKALLEKKGKLAAPKNKKKKEKRETNEKKG